MKFKDIWKEYELSKEMGELNIGPEMFGFFCINFLDRELEMPMVILAMKCYQFNLTRVLQTIVIFILFQKYNIFFLIDFVDVTIIGISTRKATGIYCRNISKNEHAY